MPAPPYSSGIAIPRKPSSPIRLTISAGKRRSRSISDALGATSRVGEVARHVADHPLLVGEVEVHFSRSFLNSCVSAGTTSKRSATIP